MGDEEVYDYLCELTEQTEDTRPGYKGVFSWGDVLYVTHGTYDSPEAVQQMEVGSGECALVGIVRIYPSMVPLASLLEGKWRR